MKIACVGGVTFGRDLLAELHRIDPESAREIERAAFRQFDQVPLVREHVKTLN
jgi:hypothetical protein